MALDLRQETQEPRAAQPGGTAAPHSTEETPSPDAILQLGFAFWGAKALMSAVELGVFTHLAANGPARREVLAPALGLHPRSAHDFLDALVALGLLNREDGAYSNTPAAALYLDAASPTYVGGILAMANARVYSCWGSLTDALRTGLPQNEIEGQESLFDAIYGDPERLRMFAQAMTAVSMGAARAIAARFPWDGYRTFADLGCAQGGLPVQVALANPHLTGVGFDLPPIKPVFEEYVASNGLSDRLSFHAGDFFSDPLPTADVYVMGHILHGWGLTEKRALIQRAYDALPPGGALLAYDAVIDDDRRSNSFGLLMSLNMLIETHAGFDYTGEECQGWMRDAGFAETRVEHLTGPYSMVIGTKGR